MTAAQFIFWISKSMAEGCVLLIFFYAIEAAWYGACTTFIVWKDITHSDVRDVSMLERLGCRLAWITFAVLQAWRRFFNLKKEAYVGWFSLGRWYCKFPFGWPRRVK